MNTTWYSHSHLAGLTFVIVHREAPFVCLAAHESGVSAVDDCRKCRTATATPAEPGDLLWMLGPSGRSTQDSGPRRRPGWLPAWARVEMWRGGGRPNISVSARDLRPIYNEPEKTMQTIGKHECGR